MQKFLNSIYKNILDIIFPIHCFGCGKNREDLLARDRWICPDCLLKINLRKEQVCPFCEKESEGGKTHFKCRDETSLDGLWVAAHYDKLVEKAVHDFKFKFFRGISHPLSGMMEKSLFEAEEFGDFQDMLLISSAKEDEEGIYMDEERNKKVETVMIPVPLHKRRYNWRGFNQSALIAQGVSDRLGIAVREDILMRVKNTKPQSKTSDGEERRKNIDNAFDCARPEEIKNKNVILLDDICTTSSTLNECAKELKKAGAKSVWGLVVARR
ncbi:MAG: ComF family protein [Candidatus Pacebacteria bacterium]|nr:ComF family protein [Candidatus Paceibacterota bacterium]